VLPRSHRETARKAFERVTKSAMPASHRELARAIEREAREYHERIAALEQQARDATAASDAGEEPDGEPVDDVDDGELGDEDLEEPQAA
jgi:hypothetical protein